MQFIQDKTQNNNDCNIPMLPLEPAINTSEIKAETLINLTAHSYKLFKDKGVINRFEPFLKDCKEQAMRRVNINEMLIFKDLEVPDAESEVLPPDAEAEKNKENTHEDKDKAQGSDVIVDTETELKPL